MKRGDTSPAIEKALVDADGVAINLTGATVRFIMARRGSTIATVNAAATIIDAAGGIVRYTWQVGDTTEHGTYDGEFEVTYTGGAIESFPNDGFLEIKVTRDLG